MSATWRLWSKAVERVAQCVSYDTSDMWVTQHHFDTAAAVVNKRHEISSGVFSFSGNISKSLVVFWLQITLYIRICVFPSFMQLLYSFISWLWLFFIFYFLHHVYSFWSPCSYFCTWLWCHLCLFVHLMFNLKWLCVIQTAIHDRFVISLGFSVVVLNLHCFFVVRLTLKSILQMKDE